MKRQAARQMRRQDADDDGDDDDHQQQGLQPVAPSPSTEGRQIRGLPKRRLAATPTSSPFGFGAANPSTPVSPLAASTPTPTFSFGTPQSSADAKPPNPFASFGGFNKPLTTTPAPSQGNKDGATASLGDTVSSPPSTAVASVSTATTAFASTSKLASVPASASAFSASGHASPPSNNGSTAASNGDATSQQQKRRWTAVRGLNLSLQKALVRQIEQRLSCDAFADLSEVLREAERQYSQFRNEAELKHTPKSNAVDGDKEAHVTGFAFTPLNAPSSAASSDKQHKDEEHKKDGDKQEPNPDTASKPPTFSLPAAGFTFGGKAVSSPSGASSSASGEAGPKFDLPKGGFSFAGQPISSTPPSTSSSEPKPTSTSGAGSSPHRFAFGSFASSTNQSETHPNPKPPAPAFATPFANTDGVQKPGSFLFGNGSISFGEKK